MASIFVDKHLLRLASCNRVEFVTNLKSSHLPVSREDIIYLDTEKTRHQKNALGLVSKWLTVRSYRNIFYKY